MLASPSSASNKVGKLQSSRNQRVTIPESGDLLISSSIPRRFLARGVLHPGSLVGSDQTIIAVNGLLKEDSKQAKSTYS